MSRPSLVWFRQDLRLEDQPALQAAIARGEPVIPVFIWSPEDEGKWRPGAASRWWLHRSLTQLDMQLRAIGSRLIVRSGDALRELLSIIDETDAAAVFWNRRYEPASIERDSLVKKELRTRGLEVESFNGQLLFEPWDVQTKEGRPYRVFTAFWNSCLAKHPPEEPEPAPDTLRSPGVWPKSLTIGELRLDPAIRWDAGLVTAWKPGAKTAREELNRFLESTVPDYETSRDLPGESGTSRLSPYLHFGEISPRIIWHDVFRTATSGGPAEISSGATTFLKEIGWREFAYHLLFHFPKTVDEPLRVEFSRFPWLDDSAGLIAWQRGQTGYPIVDAGMRELWSTGWMHNRVRMIVASFLVKDLLISWTHGADWFWDTLVDADLASNTLGWQWTAGCGADAAPYFRVFNPVLQSGKFDPAGTYLRRWLPELERLPPSWLHAPWTAPDSVLSEAGVRLGSTYPHPIVDHGDARKRALQGLASLSVNTGIRDAKN